MITFWKYSRLPTSKASSRSRQSSKAVHKSVNLHKVMKMRWRNSLWPQLQSDRCSKAKWQTRTDSRCLFTPRLSSLSHKVRMRRNRHRQSAWKLRPGLSRATPRSSINFLRLKRSNRRRDNRKTEGRKLRYLSWSLRLFLLSKNKM